jgi:hypothetical protein
MRRMRAHVLTAAIAVVLAAGSSPTVARAETRTAPPPPTPNPGRNAILTGMAARSATDAWAVGHYRNTRAHQTATLILHWNGRTWSKMPSPNPSLSENELNAVSADPSGDAWAVGFDYRHGSRALILHWGGTAWFSEQPPFSRRSLLLGVGVDSAQDAWAVGRHYSASGVPQTLALHWNGSTWSRIDAPSPGSRWDDLWAVTARSPTDAWAVGAYANGNGVVYHALILHWDGHAWSRAATPRGRSTQLFGVTALSKDDAWAVGEKHCAPVAWHWNGHTWSDVPVRRKGCSSLSAVSADSSSDAWAVGNSTGGLPVHVHSFTVHWDGTAWTHVKSPTPTLTYAFLSGVAAISASDAWAVGRFKDNHTGSYRPLILRWDGTRWRQR